MRISAILVLASFAILAIVGCDNNITSSENKKYYPYVVVSIDTINMGEYNLFSGKNHEVKMKLWRTVTKKTLQDTTLSGIPWEDGYYHQKNIEEWQTWLTMSFSQPGEYKLNIGTYTLPGPGIWVRDYTEQIFMAPFTKIRPIGITSFADLKMRYGSEIDSCTIGFRDHW